MEGMKGKKGRFGMVNGDEGDERGRKRDVCYRMVIEGMKGEKRKEKGRFGIVNGDGGVEKRKKSEGKGMSVMANGAEGDESGNRVKI